MHEVLTIKSHTDDSLVIGKRTVERFAGAVIAALGSTMLISFRHTVLPLPKLRLLLVFPTALILLGLHVALSSRNFTFVRYSQVCKCRIHVLGIFRLQRTINFCAVTYRRHFNWQTPGWLYSIILIGREGQLRRKSTTMGYAPGRVHAEDLVAIIAEFTNSDICREEPRQ